VAAPQTCLDRLCYGNPEQSTEQVCRLSAQGVDFTSAKWRDRRPRIVKGLDKTVKRHNAAPVIVLAVHMGVLAIVFFVGTAGTTSTSRDAPSAVDVALVTYVEHGVASSSEMVDGSVSGAPVEDPSREPIIPSTNRVIHTELSSDGPMLTREEIEEALLASLSASTSTAVQRRGHDVAIIQAAFHGPWRPPSRYEVGSAIVIARVVFARDGTVLRATIESPSGIPGLDASVREALQQVGRVMGLSEATLQKSDGITITFSVIQ